MSLRARLLAVVTVLVLVGLVAADSVTYTRLRSFLLGRVDQSLDGVHRPLDRALVDSGGDVLGLGFPARANAFFGPRAFIEVRDSQNTVLATTPRLGNEEYLPRLPARLPSPGPASEQTSTGPSGGNAEPVRYFNVGSRPAGGPDFRVRVSPVRGTGQLLAVALPLRDVSATLHRLLLIEVLVTAAVTLAALGLGVWLVRIGLRPLSDMSATADAIAAGDLTRRVPHASGRSEVGRLGQALNVMLGRIESAFSERKASEERLRRFVADASHELRTPLTSI